MNVLILEPAGYSEKAVALYGELGNVTLGIDSQCRMDETDVLIVRLSHFIDNRFLSKFPNIKVIVTPTTGLDHIDINACQSKGIRVFSLANCREAIMEVSSTSELALGLMIALLRNIVTANSDVVDSKNWDRDRFRSRQLSRLTLGLVGLGRIGGHMARYAKALNMSVIGCDPHVENSRFSELGVEKRSFDELLKYADIISVHVNLTESSVHLFDSLAISKMKRGVLLVNTSRGALFDERAIVAGLYAGTIGGVAVDVLENENTSKHLQESPLWIAARDGHNVIITPHIGGCTSDAMHITEERMAEYVVRTLVRAS